MALLFCDGFDNGDASQKWTAGSCSLVSTTRFGAGKALDISSPRGYIDRTIQASGTIYVGFAISSSSTASNTGPFISLYGDTGTIENLRIENVNAGVFALYRGGTQLVKATNTFKADGWHYLELAATISSTGGSFVLRVDGVEWMSYSGNTKNGGVNDSTDKIRIGRDDVLWTPMKPTIDDLYICDGQGAVNNTFLGDIRILTVLPTAAGTSTQFTPTSGANYTTVNDVPDVTTSYNASSTIGQRDTFTMGDIGTQYTVLGAQNNIHSWRSDSGTANVKIVTYTAATNYYSSSLALGTSMSNYSEVREVNPATGAQWTYADINGLETGYEVA